MDKTHTTLTDAGIYNPSAIGQFDDVRLIAGLYGRIQQEPVSTVIVTSEYMQTVT